MYPFVLVWPVEINYYEMTDFINISDTLPRLLDINFEDELKYITLRNIIDCRTKFVSKKKGIEDFPSMK